MRRLAILLVLLAGCGDGSSPIEVPPGAVRIDPSSPVSFDRVGAQVMLTAITGSAEGVRWSSSAPDVASVDAGLVTSVGEGDAWIIARASSNADSVRVTVHQTVASLAFLGAPGDVVRDQPFFAPVRLAVLDGGGFPVTSYSGTLSVSLVNGANSGSLTGTTTRSAQDGVATFDDLSVDAAGGGYRLAASAAGTNLRTESDAFDVVVAADYIVAHNGAGTALGVLVDGADGSGPFNDHGRVVQDSLLLLVASAGTSNEVIAFTHGRPPKLAPAAWTAGTDTVAFSFPDPLAIPVTIWIVKGPYADQRGRATDAVATTSLIWDDENMGLDFSDVEFVDATADTDAPSFYDLTLCNQQSQMTANIGKRAGRINIYYVGTVDGGTDRGRACPGADFIIMAERSGHELLSHEIGHQFGLAHIDGDDRFDRTNVMHSASNTRRYMTEGQVFRSHYNEYSALRSVYALRTDAARSCSDFVADLFCPSNARRLFEDGRFPADPEYSALTDWLLTTCVTDGASAPALTTAALLAAIEAGPPPRVIAEAAQAETERARALRARLDAGADFGLPPADLAGLRTRLDSPARNAIEAERGTIWREAAIAALGRMQDAEAAAALRAFSNGDDRRLAAAARRALRGIRR